MEQWNLRPRKPYEKPAIGKTLDLAALREKARAYWCGRCVTSPGTLESPCEMCGSISGTVLALLDALDAAERERDAYKRAKAENDERFMVERDVARAERDQARADLRTYGGHTSGCCAGQYRSTEAFDDTRHECDCGLAEAIERAEGR